jgi:hypothetical protein
MGGALLRGKLKLCGRDLKGSHEIMSNRRERRKAAAATRKKLAKSNTATLDQHLNDVLRRVRAEFERTGRVDSGFECVADGESFHIPVKGSSMRGNTR